MAQATWALVAVAFALSVVPPAAAHAESEAPSLRGDVAAAGHLPAIVQPHTQWQGFLQLAPGSNVTAARYQICRVGDSCFAPPAPATSLGNGSFRFDTADYLANGHAVDYQAGWRLGVAWILEERQANGTVRSVQFPEGPDLSSAACQGDAALSCNEAHYLAFDMPSAPKGAPLPSFLAPLAIAVALLLRRK